MLPPQLFPSASNLRYVNNESFALVLNIVIVTVPDVKQVARTPAGDIGTSVQPPGDPGELTRMLLLAESLLYLLDPTCW